MTEDKTDLTPTPGCPRRLAKAETHERPVCKSISLFPNDLQRLERLRHALSEHCERSVSASALMRVALRLMEREWADNHQESSPDLHA